MLLFLIDLIKIEKFRISFRFFYSFSFILRSRATSSNPYKNRAHILIRIEHYGRIYKLNIS